MPEKTLNSYLLFPTKTDMIKVSVLAEVQQYAHVRYYHEKTKR